MHDRVESWRNTEILVEPNTEDYPPWSRRPLRPMKECLAIDRRAHSHPNFIDLDCRLQRPFICEKSNEKCILSRTLDTKISRISVDRVRGGSRETCAVQVGADPTKHVHSLPRQSHLGRGRDTLSFIGRQIGDHGEPQRHRNTRQ